VGAGDWIGLLAENARRKNLYLTSVNVTTQQAHTSAVKPFVAIAAATAK